jgi:hypothetical protein
MVDKFLEKYKDYLFMSCRQCSQDRPEGMASLLSANLGDVFLIIHEENIGNAQKVMAKGNTLRNSARLYQLKFDTDNPDLEFKYAVRQSVKDGGYVKVFAKIIERN